MPGPADPVLERWAEELLARVARGASPEEQREAISGLLPLIEQEAHLVWRGFSRSGSASSEPSDVVQEIVVRLMMSPPTGCSTQSRPLVTIRAWIKRTATNHLIDLQRRRSRLRAPIDDDGHEGAREILASRRDHLAAVDAHEDLAKYMSYLEKVYPPGKRLLETQLAHPGATPAEIAELMSTSRDNCYQIQTRIRQHIARFNEKEPLPETRGS